MPIKLNKKNLLSGVLHTAPELNVKALGGFRGTGETVIVPFTEFKSLIREDAEVRQLLSIPMNISHSNNSTLKIAFLYQLGMSQLMELASSKLYGYTYNKITSDIEKDNALISVLRKQDAIMHFISTAKTHIVCMRNGDRLLETLLRLSDREAIELMEGSLCYIGFALHILTLGKGLNNIDFNKADLYFKIL